MPKTRANKRSRKPQPKSRRRTTAAKASRRTSKAKTGARSTSARSRRKTPRQEGIAMGKKVRRAIEGAPKKARKTSKTAMGTVKDIVDIGKAVAKDLRREAKSRLAKRRR